MKRLLILAVFCLILPSSSVYAQRDAQTNLRVITVTGESQVNVVPDTIVISIGVEAGGDTATEARDKEAVLVKSVMNVVKELHIDPRQIQSEALEINLVKPQYTGGWQILYDSNEPKKYGARQIFTCTLNDVSDLTPLVTQVLEVGAIKILGVEYRTSKLRKYRDQARAMAVKAAKEKAIAMAAELDQKIGKPRTITETPYYGRDWYYYGSWWGYRSSGSYSNSSQNVASESGGGNSSEDIALGQLAITAKVSVSFDLQ